MRQNLSAPQKRDVEQTNTPSLPDTKRQKTSQVEGYTKEEYVRLFNNFKDDVRDHIENLKKTYNESSDYLITRSAISSIQMTIFSKQPISFSAAAMLYLGWGKATRSDSVFFGSSIAKEFEKIYNKYCEGAKFQKIVGYENSIVSQDLTTVQEDYSKLQKAMETKELELKTTKELTQTYAQLVNTKDQQIDSLQGTNKILGQEVKELKISLSRQGSPAVDMRAVPFGGSKTPRVLQFQQSQTLSQKEKSILGSEDPNLQKLSKEYKNAPSEQKQTYLEQIYESLNKILARYSEDKHADVRATLANLFKGNSEIFPFIPDVLQYLQNPSSTNEFKNV